MGRGKKKGDQKKGTANEGETGDVPSMSSLSLSESQPSTSSTSVEGASAPESAPAAATPAPPQQEEEEDGLGLGLGGARKKRPRKKKGAGDAPAAQVSGPAHPAQATAVAPPQPQGAVQQPAPGGAMKPAAWSQPQPEAQSQAGPPPGFIAPAYPTLGNQPPPGFRPGPPQGGPPPAGPPTAGPPTAGPPPARPPTAGPPPAAPFQARPPQVGPPQARPPQTRPPQAGPPQAARKVDLRGEAPICIYKIPLKILGNTAPALKTKVVTNYLPMTIKPLKIYRYDVSFNPDKPKKMLPRAYAASKKKHFPKNLMAFDQMKNIYTLTELPGVGLTQRFTTNVEFNDDNGKSMSFEVSYKFTGIVDLSTILKHMDSQGSSLNPPTEAIQCIDVVLRQGTLESYIKAGRQFFKRPANPINLGDGFEMWTGLFQSAIFTSKAFINIDVAHKGFPIHQSLVDAMDRAFKLALDKPIENQRGRNVDSFKMFIKGLRVVANIGGDSSASGMKREFICNDLVAPPNKIVFTMTDEKTQREIRMTVAEYFQNVKRIRLRYPNLNCMWVGPRDKNIYYPLELLTVSYGQPMNKQLNEIQLANMVREAATPPHERKRKIEEVIKDMNYSQNPYFKQFGLDIKNEFLTVDAKVLNPPKLDIGGGNSIIPRNGSWMTDRLQTPQALESWGLIGLELDPRACQAENFMELIRSSAEKMGMKAAAPRLVEFNVRLQDLTKWFRNGLEKGIRVLFIIVSGRGRDYYHRVKQVAECEVGILTQCIKENTAARRMNPQTAKNILLKVNSKLMGVNQALHGTSTPRCLAAGGVMVVGADVTHPSPDQSSIPSIAAVTASMDNKCYRYNIQLSIQTPKKEVIVEFEDMMVEHLQVYRKHQKQLPKKIFVFRDGVSEGQFAQVMNSELAAVHKAYQRLSGGEGRPEVLFLLVQKRHHTRFFSGPNNPKNVEPGTVVDTQIVHPSELDFYLVSHQAIKGTARPTRYHAVCNDGNIPHDEVEQLTFYLCHLYSRCMRSVSYPTPTYYAHLACLRARSLTFGQKFDNEALEKQPQRLNVLDRMLACSRMFFV